MNKMNKYLVLFSLLFLCNCVAKIKPDDFTSTKKTDKAKIILGFEFDYNGSTKYFNSGFPSQCHIFFADNNDKIIKYKFYQSSEGVDYVLLNTNADKVYLTSIDCLSSKLLYNKARLRRINQEIFAGTLVKDKVNYIGNIKIEWKPEIFKISDLFLLGTLGMNDNGKFSLNIEDHYDNYLDFMNDKFNISPDKSMNIANKDAIVKDSLAP